MDIKNFIELPNRLQKFKDSLETDSIARNQFVKRAKTIRSATLGIVRWLFLICLSVVLLYPLIIMLSISLRNPNEIFDPTVVWIPKHFTLESFQSVIEKLNFLNIAFTTGLIAVVCTFLQLVSCSLAGYGFARFNFRFKGLLFSLLLFSIIVPPLTIIIPSYVNFISFDFFGIGSIIGIFTGKALTVSLIDNIIAYFLPALFTQGIKGGLFIFIFIQFFRGLPKELEDAAYIDGCGRLFTFVRIMLPNSSAPFLTVTLFSVVWYWNDFFYNSMYFNNLPVISKVLQNITILLGSGISTSNPYDVITQTMASAMLAILPILVIYIILQRYFTESIERTGIVG